MGPRNEGVARLVLLPPIQLPRTIDVSANSKLLTLGVAVPSLSAFLEALIALDGQRTGPPIFEPKYLRAPMSEKV